MNLQSLGLPGVALTSYQQIADLSSKVSLTVPAAATGAIIRVTDLAARVRFDGTDPTATVGMVITAGVDCVIHGRTNLVNAEFIQTTPADAEFSILNVQYFTNNP